MPYFEHCFKIKRLHFAFTVFTQWYSYTRARFRRSTPPPPPQGPSLIFARSVQLPNSTQLRLEVCNWPRSAYVPPSAHLLNHCIVLYSLDYGYYVLLISMPIQDLQVLVVRMMAPLYELPPFCGATMWW